MYAASLKLGRVIILTVILFFFTVPQSSALTTYSYDPNGNMISDGTTCYEYNDINQLAKVKNCSSNQLIAEYIYDYTGKRTIKKEYNNGVLENTIYDIDPSFETKITKNDERQDTTYYYVDKQVVARKNADGTKNFYHNDNLGSTNVITNQTSGIVENSTYYPFGETREGGEKSKYLFTGQEKDQETNLYYYDSRYYNPQLKRFIQPDSLLPDPYDPQQINRYSYVKNNPLRYTDPSGHCAEDICFVEGIVALAVIQRLAASPITTNVARTVQTQTPNIVNTAQNITKLAPVENAAVSIGNKAQSLISQNYAKGMLGEQNGIQTIKNTFRVESLTNTAKFRIPDEITKLPNNTITFLNEVKNVNEIRITNQLKDFAALGQRDGFLPNLTIDLRTQIAKGAQEWVKNSFNVIRTNLNWK